MVDDLCGEIFSRNVVFITDSEQEILQESTVAIAGVGGVGGLLAERLVRLGVGHLKITDPEDFELSNLNRQLGSTMLNVGQNKAGVLYALLKDINPRARISHSDAGVTTQDDAEILVSGCDLVIDEMDFGLFRESIFLQRAARQNGLYYISASAVGFGALVRVFDPRGLTLEEYYKLAPDVDLDSGDGLTVPLDRISPVIPSYALAAAVEANAIIAEIVGGQRPAPNHSIGNGLASVLGANEAANVLLGKRSIPSVPQYIHVDLMDQQFVVASVS